jgi:hypothetical protein
VLASAPIKLTKDEARYRIEADFDRNFGASVADQDRVMFIDDDGSVEAMLLDAAP